MSDTDNKIIPPVTPKEEPKVDDADKIVGEVDASKIETEVAEKVAKKVQDDLVEKITGGKKEEKWQPLSYEEIKEATKKETLDEFQKMEKEKEAKTKETEKTAEAERGKRMTEWNKHWDNQLTELAKDNRIPQVAKEIQEKLTKNETLTDDDRKDEGLQARVKMFQLGRENKESNLELVYYKYYNKKQKATTAPVFGSQKSVNSSEPEDFTYESINKSSFDEIVAGK